MATPAQMKAGSGVADLEGAINAIKSNQLGSLDSSVARVPGVVQARNLLTVRKPYQQPQNDNDYIGCSGLVLAAAYFATEAVKHKGDAIYPWNPTTAYVLNYG